MTVIRRTFRAVLSVRVTQLKKNFKVKMRFIITKMSIVGSGKDVGGFVKGVKTW